VPPWINKFYILDLNKDKSFIRWAVAQGLTVFCISWINPDERHADKGFAEYMREGVFAALLAVREATRERKVTTIGYCVGGTLLATALAYMAANGDDRVESATFFTTQVDFTYAGDLKVFFDQEQLKSVEESMKTRGYLEGSHMANAFNMLRPNDLIWPYVQKVYMKGQAPMPFDLLYWNSDATRMPATNHAFYLRNCYMENNLARGEMEIDGFKLDLSDITIPIFNLAAREDHIAPARSVFLGSQLFGGPVEFVVAGSGHIAGVVNPPAKSKYQFWTNGPVEGDLETWLAKAKEHPGSWWPYWFEWLERQAPERVKARKPGSGKLKPLGDAPGTYVLVKS
jgi:polyhydroxyalkanoate synthase